MKKNNLKRFLASLLAVLMLSQVTGVAPGVFALDETGTTEPTESAEPVAPVLKENTGAVEVLIKSDTDVKDALAKALLANYSELTKEQIAAIDWQYECEGYLKGDPTKTALYDSTFGSVNGFDTYKLYEKDGFFHKKGDIEFTYVHPNLKDQKADKTFKVCIGDDHDNYRKIVKVDKYSSKIVLKTDASITYNMESDVMKQAILDNVIDWEASDLPAKETLSINDFKFEWKTLPEFTDKLPLDKDKLEKYKAFAPIEGGKGCEVINVAFDCPRMGAGEQVIRVKYVGGSDYKASDYVEGNLTVKKADVKVSIPLIAKIYAGEPLETKENPYATLDPNDPAIDIYKFFVGENSNLQSVAYIDLPASKTKLIDAISDAQVKYLGYAEKDTIRGKLQEGVTIGELKAAMTEIVDYASKDPLTKFFVNAMLKKYGITVDNLKDLVDTLNTITKIADNFKIAIGTPDHAGAYFAFVIAVNDNYNPAYAAGSLIVLKNWKNIKLEKNPVLNSGDKANTITVSQAEELKEGNNLCILTKDGESLNSASAGSIHYWFTGVNKIYAKSVMPTAPGRYIVTASVRGGDFFAFPKTFSFTIVADPTPEVTPEA